MEVASSQLEYDNSMLASGFNQSSSIISQSTIHCHGMMAIYRFEQLNQNAYRECVLSTAYKYFRDKTFTVFP